MRDLRVFAKERPGALPLPCEHKVSALTKPNILERWAESGAGVRPAALAIDDSVITMFDVIGEDHWSGGGITAKSVAAQLRGIGDRPIEVQINSPGGDMFEGIAIYNVLREHAQPIDIKIMGMAASAASIVAMAGDNISIGSASFLMVHNCWVMAVGNRHDMAQIAADLEPFDLAMAEVYAARSGQTLADCQAWMDAETYMSGSQAIERGFADSLLAADAVKTEEKVKSEDRKINDVRAMELTLCASGLTRTEARSRIKSIKGTPDAADNDLSSLFAGFLSTIRS
jgi:ATP-dependent Clp protease protease subunit